MIPEAHLRSLWHQRCFDFRPLITTDGRPIEIHRAGSPNGDAGPDFTDALLRIGKTMYRGDVEVHVNAADWENHRHGSDPHYNRVVLHVALAPPRQAARTASGRVIPLLLLPPLHELPEQPHCGHLFPFPGLPPLRCAESAPPQPASLRHHLRRLAFVRMERKVSVFAERLEQLHTEVGARGDSDPHLWEQLIYEGILEGLGYAKNREPFLALARNVPIQLLQRYDLDDAGTMRAILFGAAGLLPSGSIRAGPETRRELRILRSRWLELRPSLPIPIMHGGEWRFFRLRPVNFPTARLAAFSTLLPRLFGNGRINCVLDSVASRGVPPSEHHRKLEDLLLSSAEGYWSRHYCFSDPSGHCSAIGRSRANDIIVNTLIPAGLMRARLFSQPGEEGSIHLLYRTFPPLQQNRILSLLQRDLLRNAVSLATAPLQQGGLELYHAYCRDGRCFECPLHPVRRP